MLIGNRKPRWIGALVGAAMTAAALIPRAAGQAQSVPTPPHEPSAEAPSNAGIVRYEALYGVPEDIPLEEVARMLDNRQVFAHAIRTRGRFDDRDRRGRPGSSADRSAAAPTYSLCEGRRCLAPIQPVAEIAKAFGAEVERLSARELELVGAFESGHFAFWSYTLATAAARPGGPGGSALQDLVNRKTPFENKDVTVRGQFRGENLFGDLPAGSALAPTDWVLADGPFSVWVTGKAPRGSGFSLNPASRADCVYWLDVEGRPERHGEVVVLKAKSLRFLGRSPNSPGPTENAPLEPPRGRRRGGR
jgi:hypothetical protein